MLKYLRNRLPPDSQVAPSRLGSKPAASNAPSRDDTENVPPPNQTHVAGRTRDAQNPLEVKRPRMSSNQPSGSLSSTARGASNNSQTAAVALVNSAKQPARTDGAPDNSSALMDLDKKILMLENSLEDFALTAAKKFALKKELAMVRSQKIRLLRSMQP